MIKLLIADNHVVVRRGLKRILADAPDIVVAGEAASGEEVLNAVRGEDWDAVVLDITMPGSSGLDVLKQLKHERPQLPVLILSVHAEEQYAVRALRAGAAGYMAKNAAPTALVEALRRIVNGRRYVSSDLAELLASEMAGGNEARPHHRLSDREFQVMLMIASGRTIMDIAEGLALSPKTVSTYRRRLLQKMGLASNADLIRYTMQNRLIE
jgi:DNA-binding NarL/FixJ family response regulator